MTEIADYFSTKEHDRRMGMPEELCGQVTPEAQMARYLVALEHEVPEHVARGMFGLTDEDFHNNQEI